MIYLIGGPPRCGKTTIAKALSKKKRIPWMSADALESIVGQYISGKDFVKRFPKTKMRRATKNSNDVMYERFSASEIRRAYIKQAKTSWDAIRMMVEVAVLEGHDYVIEGHQIHPTLMKELVAQYGKEIRPVVLTRFDETGIVDGCLKHKAKNDWFIQKTKNSSTYPKIAKMIATYSRYFDREATKHRITRQNMDGDFDKKLRSLVSTFGK